MSRQRTKVGEHIELHRDGQRLFVPAAWERKLPLAEQRAEVRARRANVGGQIVKVTRYRLAPLVELRWERDADGDLVIRHEGGGAGGGVLARIEIDGADGGPEDRSFEAFIYGGDYAFPGLTEILHSQMFESSPLSEAKRWVARHLRELGFKVAKARKS
jgi:hypothetical protein